MRAVLMSVLLLLGGRCWAIEWEPVVEPYGQIFPSLELSTATMDVDPPDDPTLLGDPNSLIGASITAERNRQRVRLEIFAPRLIESAVFEGVLPKAGVTYTVYPSIGWNFDTLAAFRQPAPGTLRMRLRVDGEEVGDKVTRVRVRSVNDALYWVGDEETGETLDFNWMFAAYVNEDHPLVDEILQAALQTGIVDEFTGYQNEDVNEVYRQVFAIWYVLQQRGIRYSSITRTSSEHSNVLSQYVRFIDQSWNNTQANCVDGSVLFASVLRKIDINPMLVMVPAHALLGFALDAEGEQFGYLETTLLGARDEVGSGSLAETRALIGNGKRVGVSFRNFEAAVETGEATVTEGGEKFADEEENEYQIVDVQAARESGVMPIVPR